LQDDPAGRRPILDRTLLGRWGTPADVAQVVAQVVAFLCSTAAGFMTGVILPLHGGYLVAWHDQPRQRCRRNAEGDPRLSKIRAVTAKEQQPSPAPLSTVNPFDRSPESPQKPRDSRMGGPVLIAVRQASRLPLSRLA
jgi:hypothetical protein